jgi:hypothetical protein
MIMVSDYFRDTYRHHWAIHQPQLVCLHFNMGSQLRSKRVRLTLFSVSFFLLFAFWLVALYCGLRGGLTFPTRAPTSMALSFETSQPYRVLE